MGIFNKNKVREVSYVDTHNRAVIRYRRACRTFIWVGVVNFVGLLIGIIQYYTQKSDWMTFCYCFGVSDFLFSLLFPRMGETSVWFWLIVAFFSIITTAGAVLLGVFSSYGKKKVLFAMVIAYFVDWIMVFLAHFVAGEDLLGFLINAGIHVIASFFIILAIYQYYMVLNIEKRFKDIPTVAEMKEKEKAEETENADQP